MLWFSELLRILKLGRGILQKPQFFQEQVAFYSALEISCGKI
jgi:hypothetical protein